MRTMIYRYTVMQELLGIRFDNTEPICRLPKADIVEILSEIYSEQKERLLFLVASGVLEYDNVRHLIIKCNTDILNDVKMLEARLMEDDEIPYSVLEQALVVSAETKKSSLLTTYDFDSILGELKKMPEITIKNGLVGCANKEYQQFLFNIGMIFVTVDEETGEIKKCEIQDDNAFPADGYKCMLYQNVYNKTFGKDFIEHIVTENYINGDNIADEYEKYVTEQRLTFDICGYVRRRHICGDTVNHFDYDFNRIEDNELVESTMKSDSNYKAQIKLSESDVKAPCSDEELIIKALNKYKKINILPDDFLAEVFYNTACHYFVYKQDTDKFQKVRSAEFSMQLFDFNKIWSVVRKAAAENKIMVINNNLTFPYIDEILPEEQTYALALAKEQYEIKLARKQESKHISTLKKLISDAKSEINNKEQEKIDKIRRLNEAKAKMNNRITNTTA